MERAVVNSRGAARWVSRQHPWIYAGDVVERPAGGPGAVEVVDTAGERVGVGLWSPASTISLRMMTREAAQVDVAFWGERIARAAEYRRRLRTDGTAYRVVHAEADGLPSLIADRYGEWLVVQYLSAGLEAFRAEVTAALVEVLEPRGMLARNDVPVRAHERLERRTELLHGAVPESIEVCEAGVRYLAAPWTGQKTGAYLDQRENRSRAGSLSRGRALDCFSYHGSFALHLARGADEVVGIDSSAEALERADANASLNSASNLRFEQANAFDYLRAQEAEGARWDVIVLDPPAFAKRRDAVGAALRGYKELNLRALRILSPGGVLMTFSCSYHVDRERFRGMLESAARDSGRPVRWLEARGQATDHPELVQIPESGYLKGAVLQAA